jgi:hypothetical protein
MIRESIIIFVILLVIVMPIFGQKTLNDSSAKGMDDTFVSFLSGVIVALIIAIIANIVTYYSTKNTIEGNLKGIEKTIEGNLKGIEKTIEGNLKGINETAAGNLKGIKETIEGNIKTTELTIGQEKYKISKEEHQKEINKRRQVYSQLKGIIFVEDQLITMIGIGVLYIGYYTTKHRLSKAKEDNDKAEKWREATNKNEMDLAMYNQKLWETIGLAELLFPDIEKNIAVSKETLFNAAEILDPLFQSKKKEALRSDIESEMELEYIKEKAISEIKSEINKTIVAPLNQILDQMREVITNSS